MSKNRYHGSWLHTGIRGSLWKRQWGLLLFLFLEGQSATKYREKIYAGIEERRKIGWIAFCIGIFTLGNVHMAWGQLPFGCNYEIDMNWKADNIKASPGFRAGYIGISTGADSDKAIMIHGNAKFWIHGSNQLNDNSYYYRLIVTGSPTICLDNVSIQHREKVPLWIKNGANVTLILSAGTSRFVALEDAKPGIQVENGANITIEGTATLEAKGGNWGAGIGGVNVSGNSTPGNITIKGGTIRATGGKDCAGIGGGQKGNGGNITISGGDVTAQGGENGAGIGGGFYANGGNITIKGGTINATGGTNAAGIGGGNQGDSGSVEINSSSTEKITATGGSGAPGIGCGNNGVSLNVTLKEGFIKAKGIGGGSSGTLTIGGFYKAFLTGNYVAYRPEIETTGWTYGFRAASINIKTGYLVAEGTIADVDCITEQGTFLVGSDNEELSRKITLQLDGTKNSLSVGRYTIHEGTIFTTSQSAKSTCSDLCIKGGSVIINTPKNCPITDGVNNVYRLKVRGYDLKNLIVYTCKVANSVITSFKACAVDGYFHFWVPRATANVVVDGKTILIDQITDQNEDTWYLDNLNSLFVNRAPLAIKELDGSNNTLKNRYFDFNTAFTNATDGNILQVYFNHSSFFTTDIKSTKKFTLDLNGKTLAGTGSNGLIVTNSLILTESSGTTGTVDVPITVENVGVLQLKKGTRFPLLNKNVTIDGKISWWAQINGTNWENINTIKQDTRSLPLNRLAFNDADGFYCWLDNTKNNLTFNAGMTPSKYYYTTNPDPANKHGQLLTAATFKAYTGTNTKTWHKTLPEAFAAATNFQSICLADDINASNETATLKSNAGTVTLDLQTFMLGGTQTLNANGSRLILTSTVSDNPGKLTGTTHLQGLVYSDLSADQLGNRIYRQGTQVYRYYAYKMLAKDQVWCAWNKDQSSDQAMIENGKACLWLPSGSAASGTVSLGYSSNMAVDKCGELLNVPVLSAHATNAELVHPILNIKHSDVELGAGPDNKLAVTHKGVTVNNFDANQNVTVYGEGAVYGEGVKSIRVATGATINHLTLRDLTIKHTGTNTVAPIDIPNSSTLHLYLSGKNSLQGGGANGTVKAGIEVAPQGTLHIYNDADGNGRLYAKGGSYMTQSGAGIGGGNAKEAGNITIHGGTIQAEGGLTDHWGIGNGKGVASSNYPVVRIEAGSVRATRQWEGKTLKQDFIKEIDNAGTKKDEKLYLMTVNTGLSPNKKYNCIYYGVKDPFPAMTDELGKCYFWIPVRTQDEKPTAVFTDPSTQNSYTIQLVKVDANDDNVAPIVCELLVEGQPSVYHNSLKDAFDAVPAGRTATIKLLTDLDNLSTLQEVKAGCDVTLDLDRFNLDTKNSNSAGFNVQLGGYLYITGRGTAGTGNIKSTFRISGDLFIDGMVPLTDATPKLDDKAMFRTLIKGLPGGEKTTYTYSYGTISNRSFNLHDGLACLWLPDANAELTFRVTQGNNVTDYTAGTLSTNVQRTDPIPASPVGVVARLTMKDGSVRDFNSLEDAFEVASSGSDNVVVLLANISLTKKIEVPSGADFMLNLNGMSLTANGVVISIASGGALTVVDRSSGTKGQLKCDWIADGKLFVASNVNINISSVVKRSANNKELLYRTIAGVSNLSLLPTEVTCASQTSKVVEKEACFWLPSATGKDLEFTLGGGQTESVTGVNINNNHQDNMLTLGMGNDEVTLNGTPMSKFVDAWKTAKSGDRIELLKDAAVGEALTLSSPKLITVDLVRYSLNVATGATNAGIAVGSGSTLILTSANGNGRMQVPVMNSGVLFVDQSIQPDRLTGQITNAGSESLWRALVSNLPQGMPDDAVFNFEYGAAGSQQTGSFYVKNATACLWLKVSSSQRLNFPQFTSYTDNVTIENNHANKVIWGQNNVAQVQSSLYTSLKDAFTQNSNQTVTLLKSAVLGKQAINSEMQLKMEGYSISPASTTEHTFEIQKGGSLRVSGAGTISVDFSINFLTRIPGSNANLVIAPDVNIDKASVMEGTTTYYRTSVTLPQDVAGEMTYTYGTRNSGSVKAVANEPLTLWLNVPEGQDAYDFKLTSADGVTYLASNVRIISTHVNPITVQKITDEAFIQKPDGSNDYHKTLAEALAAATNGQTVVLGRNLPEVTDLLQIKVADKQAVTLDLDKHTLTGGKGIRLDAGNGQLLVENGTLKGFLTVKGNVFADASTDMNGLQVENNDQKTVWRTLLKLPGDGSIPLESFEYKWSDGLRSDTYETCTNINKDKACLWLPSSNQVRSLVVKAGDLEYSLNNVIIASTHGNELNVTDGNDPVAETPKDGKTYASLASAFAMVGEGETVKLKNNLTLASIQDVKGKSFTLDLAGFSFTSGNSGFDVETNRKLSIMNGMLQGTLRLQGEGSVSADNTVKIGGFIFKKDMKGEEKEVFRTQVKVASETQCHWLPSASFTYDLQVTPAGNTDTYEATVPAKLSDHNTELTAYKRMEVASGLVSWNTSSYQDVNLVLRSGATLDITAASGGILHRLTIEDGAKVTGSGQVRVDEAIHYVRSFTEANRWESIALPFTAMRITAEKTTGVASLLTPALGNGVAGDFWLNTLSTNGALQDVNSTEMTANVSYLMAVSTDLKAKAITFVSGPNQLLNRSQVLAVKPTSGFASYANGTLGDITVKEPCYLLSADGTMYERKEGTSNPVAPFRGYLLADVTTTTITPRFMVGRVPTGITPIQPSALKVLSGHGRLILESDRDAIIYIHSLNGYCIDVFRMDAGRMEVTLPAGFYIVNGQKVVVRQ